jgi:hypothetical protein
VPANRAVSFAWVGGMQLDPSEMQKNATFGQNQKYKKNAKKNHMVK